MTAHGRPWEVNNAKDDVAKANGSKAMQDERVRSPLPTGRIRITRTGTWGEPEASREK